ncbi:hypothetical protein [Nocardia sp. NPDC003963]
MTAGALDARVCVGCGRPGDLDDVAAGSVPGGRETDEESGIGSDVAERVIPDRIAG